MCSKILILLAILQLFSSIKGSGSTTNTKRVVCYYGGIRGKQTKNLLPEDIDASVCTHITYLQGDINTELEEIHITPIFEVHQTGGPSYTEKLEKLKEANPNLKLLLFVSPEHIPWVLESAERRTKIIESAVALLNATKFDGLDFSTTFIEGAIDDFSTFLCEMHAEFEKYGYILSVVGSEKLELNSVDTVVQRFSRQSGSIREFVPTIFFVMHAVLRINAQVTGKIDLDSLTHVAELARNTHFMASSRCSSFITVLTIENWMSRSNTTRLIAPINLTMTVVDRYIEKGYPANKLLISIPTFGLIVTLTDPKQTGVGVSIDGPGSERTEVTDGYTLFYSTVRPTVSAQYILEKNLGGALFFTLDMDDFSGTSGKTFPIIRVVSDTFQQSVRASDASP
ncbi:hypothetical protein J437_LFUL000837 [Ladona fulva]|uniref:GH18 domain-containing protein n=1 Tax=Ladona fulva TaxID=123851 RepID=A0A8K0JTN7_LADFU|nr:hypothetical protein J437_LFUL000837 [Ladona fulva]